MLTSYAAAIEVLSNAATLGLPVPQDALDTITGARCSTCRWWRANREDYCLNEATPLVELVAADDEHGFDGHGDPATFGCPMWERKQ